MLLVSPSLPFLKTVLFDYWCYLADPIEGDGYPSSSVSERYGASSVTSSYYSSYNRDSLRLQKTRIERERARKGLNRVPRSCSPNYSTYAALCDALLEKELEINSKTREIQPSTPVGRGL